MKPSGPMMRALSLAAGAIGRTSPNPAVGAVVVKDGQIVGEGSTQTHGKAHAEPTALAQAGGQARGSTLYVTLEPCSHWGRTPPCVDALIVAGVSEVVVATLDPNPLVAGAGIRRLREASICVRVGDGSRQARVLMSGFATWIASKKPLVTMKFAASLDGRIATRTGDSKWISGPPARAWAHHLRDRSDAILVGVGTVLADDPALTTRIDRSVREPRDPFLADCRPVRTSEQATVRHPLRIILDTHLRTPVGAQVATGQLPGRTMIVATETADRDRRRRLTDAGAEVVFLSATPDGRPDLGELLLVLGERGVTTIIVEGGATVHGSFLDGGHVDRIAAVISPLVIGGSDAPSAVGGAGAQRLTDAYRVTSQTVTRLGVDTLITGVTRSPIWPEDTGS